MEKKTHKLFCKKHAKKGGKKAVVEKTGAYLIGYISLDFGKKPQRNCLIFSLCNILLDKNP